MLKIFVIFERKIRPQYENLGMHALKLLEIWKWRLILKIKIAFSGFVMVEEI